MKASPIAGRDYPSSLVEVRSWFRSDADCLDYLDWLRWPEGFCCPWCAGVGEWSAFPGMHRCYDCGRRITVRAGTTFHRTRTPLTVWFEAAWLMMVSKQGLSALNLQRTVGLGSYQTAWTLLHRFRAVMGSVGREQLTGRVEMDESLIGGKRKPGVRGRGAAGKTMVAGAIEQRGRGFGRARLQVIPNASTRSLHSFIHAHIKSGATLITDGLSSYPGAVVGTGIAHEIRNVSPSGLPDHISLPGIHLLFSLLKRVLDGTYQGSTQTEHLQDYLDEFIFRFNRRTAHDRGLLFFKLLEASVAGSPTTYGDISVIRRKPGTPPRPPRLPSHSPATLAGTPAGRPWRSA